MIFPTRRMITLAVIGTAITTLISCTADNEPGALIESQGCGALLGNPFDDTIIESADLMETRESTRGMPQPTTRNIDVSHCRVTGKIDSKIGFELLLPNDWNGKFLMGGGGVFVGSIQNNAQDEAPAGWTALERGYATVGTDTGHTASRIDGSWALNDSEAKDNYAYRSVHRTAEISKQVIAHYYGQEAELSYFHGCSNGGFQALMSAQRFPDDFDGIIAGAPALDRVVSGAGRLRIQQALFPDPESSKPSVVTPGNLKLLGDVVLNSCDAIDGLADGLITDPRNCPNVVNELPRCDDDAVSDCVTDAQREALERIFSEWEIESGFTFTGYPLSAETALPFWTGGLVQVPPGIARPGARNLSYAFLTQFAKYFIFSDPDWSYVGYTFDDWIEKTSSTVAIHRVNDPDLSAFRDNGGKLILWHGWSDSVLSPLGTVKFYEGIEEFDSSAHDYARLFLLPSVLHCGGGPGPDRVDWLTALEQWVENDKSPQQILASKNNEAGETTMERPTCSYPQVAQHDGGDSVTAESFSCVSPRH